LQLHVHVGEHQAGKLQVWGQLTKLHCLMVACNTIKLDAVNMLAM
jgi:hypothetical protein